MSVYTPAKKSLPSWMMMNEQTSKHWMNSFDVDMEINGKDGMFTQADLDDGITDRERRLLQGRCIRDSDWNFAMTYQKTSRACDLAAMKYPEFNIRHAPCYAALQEIISTGAPTRSGNHDNSCNMYSPVSGKLYPEFAKCLKPEAVDDADCQRQCYAYPNQVGCETIVAGLSAEDRLSKLRALGPGIRPGDVPEPEPETPPEETVVISASMRSVSPTAINFAYMDPKTKKAVVVKKTLVDMYKPTDKVAVVLNKKTKNFVGLQKK